MRSLPSLTKLPQRQINHIEQLARELSRRVASWAQPFGNIFHQRLFDNISLIIAFSAPNFPIDRLDVITQYSVWAYALDQAMDEEAILTLDDFSSLEETINGIVTGATTPRPSSYLETSLVNIIDQLKHCCTSNELSIAFEKAVGQSLSSGRTLLEASRLYATGGDLLGIEDFLFHATHDVLHISCCIALLMLTDANIGDLNADVVQDAMFDAGFCVRLANDLRTYEKDQSEQRINILSYHWTEEQVWQAIRGHLINFDNQLEILHDQGVAYPPLQCVRNLTYAGIEMYGITDLHYQI